MSDTSDTSEQHDETQPVASRPGWRERAYGIKGVAAVAVAGLVIGGGAGAAIHAATDDDGRDGPGRMGFQRGPGGQMPPGGFGGPGGQMPGQGQGQMPGQGGGPGQGQMPEPPQGMPTAPGGAPQQPSTPPEDSATPDGSGDTTSGNTT